MSIPQNQQGDDLELGWAPEVRAFNAPAEGDDDDRDRTGFSSWSLEVACANAQRW